MHGRAAVVTAPAENNGRILRQTRLTQSVGRTRRIGFCSYRPITESRLTEDLRSVWQSALGGVVKAPLLSATCMRRAKGQTDPGQSRLAPRLRCSNDNVEIGHRLSGIECEVP